MHVGHLRSTIQGDSICRVFEFLGYDVLRVNHVGDWGTQFGMLIAELDERFPNFLLETPQIADLQTFYQNAKKRFDQEETFKQQAYANVVKLQSGDDHCIKAWQKLCELSRIEFNKIYDRLDVKLKEVGESFYNPFLGPMVHELMDRKIAVESEGAICVFIPKQKVPLMIRKSDGGFNYDTTDMAAIRYRTNELKCDRIVYVTDVGQEFHFKQVFQGAQLCGFYDPKQVQVDHMPFGMILQETMEEAEEGKEAKKKIEKIKTREGKSVKLVELLDEARDRAIKMFKERLESDQADTKV
jgi:arginyl-tRNA synthetase